MFQPVGSHSPAVYWRRRMVLAGFVVLLVVLIALTVRTVAGGDGGAQPAAAGVGGASGAAGAPAPRTASTPATGTAAASAPTAASAGRAGAGSSRAAATAHTTTAHTTTSRTTTTRTADAPAAGPAPCPAGQLTVAAVVGSPQYSIGAKPVLSVQVTNTGSAPCVQDVADSQILLRVYNGAARVWSSHDCDVTPGVTDRTLEPGRPAKFSIDWGGYTSQPHCAGGRQHVGAGVYTLYASLAGQQGTAARFTMS